MRLLFSLYREWFILFIFVTCLDGDLAIFVRRTLDVDLQLFASLGRFQPSTVRLIGKLWTKPVTRKVRSTSLRISDFLERPN